MENDQKTMTIRRLRKKDMSSFMRLAERFFNESYHKGDNIRLDWFEKLVKRAMDLSNVAIPVAVVDGEIVGYAIINANAEFKEELEGELSELYVAPEYRGTSVSRELAREVVEQFDEWDCKTSHVWAAPQLKDHENNLALFRNLWAKYGYVQTGIILTRQKGV